MSGFLENHITECIIHEIRSGVNCEFLGHGEGWRLWIPQERGVFSTSNEQQSKKAQVFTRMINLCQ